ncbi:MAG: DUF4058 family protein [Cyanobacteria bacterium J06643_4]
MKKKNQTPGTYSEKRQRLLATQTHLIEIDLLRTGSPMLVEGGRQSDYQVLVSRANERPAAARYPFDLKDPLPRFPLPLMAEDAEPIIELQALLNQACIEAALDLAIDYEAQPVPPLSSTDALWLLGLRRQA